MSWFKRRLENDERLLGRWVIDPTDSVAASTFGDVAIEFDERGNLIYIIKEDEKDQAILMTYKVDGDSIRTDQPSHPDPQTTKYQIIGDVLTLSFGGTPARFTRLQ